MYSPDSAFTGRHPVVGPYPARMTRTRNYEFDFMSCFSKHISDYEKAGRKGSAANYRSSYRLLLSFLDGQHLTSQHLSARWAERYERWLRARGVTTNTVTFHLRNLRAVYNRSVKKRLIPASFPNPFTHLTVRQTVTRKRGSHAKPSNGYARPTSRRCIPSTPSHATSSCSVSSPAACRS